MRKSTQFLLFTVCSLALLVLMTLHARHVQASGQGAALARARMVKEYQLTDLCLFTEARYTRHPSMADLHSPFQDHPTSLEHFPSGSLISPPDFLARRHEQSP
jgi:hypothetical protein